MTRVYFVILICLPYISSQLVTTHKQSKSPCDTSVKNALIEHFFNIIFTEFHSTPPVCVCVQMCAGQSTYCYPNGCLKRDELKRVDSPQTLSQNLKKYAFVVEEKNDFMKDYFERNDLDESKLVSNGRQTVLGMLPDIFNDNHSGLGKYKKAHNVELKYNFREQVKNKKSDLLKLETSDLSKTRWPMHKHNHLNGHKISANAEIRPPLVGRANFFMSMLPATDYAEYPPKYFKRDLTKLVDDGDINVKAFYLFEKLFNDTETMTLETLINNLLQNSFKTKPDEIRSETESKFDTEREGNITKPITNSQSITSLDKNTLNTNSYDNQENNKYNDYILTSTNNFNGMIRNLSKHIEKQNNTSMEIAKRIVGDINAEDITMKINSEIIMKTFNSTSTENIIEMKGIPESTTANVFQEKMVTRKNRQKKARKLHNRKQLI